LNTNCWNQGKYFFPVSAHSMQSQTFLHKLILIAAESSSAEVSKRIEGIPGMSGL
jgi:hypothetical protein